MNADQENSGNKVVHGIERKVGMAVLGMVFLFLFVIGAAVIWNKNRTIQQQQKDLKEQTAQLEGLVSDLQERIESSKSVAVLEEIDTQKLQTITLSNGDMYIGRVVEKNPNELTVEKHIKLNSSENANNSNNQRLRINLKDIRLLKNVDASSALGNMVNRGR